MTDDADWQRQDAQANYSLAIAELRKARQRERVTVGPPDGGLKVPRFIDVARPRAANDWYSDPPEAIEALLNAEVFAGTSWDPACGAGTIPKAGIARGLRFLASDIADRGYGLRQDFLEPPCDAHITESIANIVANPPYKEAQRFAERALAIAAHKVALLLPLTFLEGQARAKWLTCTPLARIHVFPWRISMPPGELLHAGKVRAAGGKKAFCWCVWEKGWQGPPQLRWLAKPKATS